MFRNNDNGYIVARFKVNKTDYEDSYNVTITGIMPQLIDNMSLTLHGEEVYNERFSKNQFQFVSYEKIVPNEEEKILEFLVSPFVNGCGKKTAEKLVSKYKKNTIEEIKNIDNILSIEGISEKNAIKINKSILDFSKSSDDILKLQNMNFTIDEASKIYLKYEKDTMDIIENDFFSLKDIINFNKLDSVYLQNNEYDSFERIYACVLEVMRRLSESDGHVYYKIDLIKDYLSRWYSLFLSDEDKDEMLFQMQNNNEIVIENDRIYLREYYECEENILKKLEIILNNKVSKITDFDEKIKENEKKLDIEYDYKQKGAIKSSLCNNVTIISGGPGTGKTTILNSIAKMYINEKKLGNAEVIAKIALLAPTGRAAKKMSLATGLSAFTIHRFLKWNKESDTFEFNEYNKLGHQFIIIDECSMIDLKLFSALLSALKDKVKIVLVGDAFQLPPVSAGMVFSDLIQSELFDFTSLTRIYRQSDNSYIPDLALSIKNMELTESFLEKKDDYNFIRCPKDNINNVLAQSVLAAKSKGISEFDLQVLVPLYKGVNGIDNINKVLRDVYNPSNIEKNEVVYNQITYREGDKILQLNNDVEKNIFNGDVGKIYKISYDDKKIVLKLKFDNDIVSVEKTYLKNITHAYAISIHKSQGSEFDHVIMPVSSDYFLMMYNKLLYTGVSRAKKSLTLIGDASVFNQGVNNNRTSDRKTCLKEKLLGINLKNT